MKLSYLLKEKLTGRTDESNVTILIVEDGKYAILNVGKDLLMLDTVPRLTSGKIPLRTSDMKCDEIKAHFKAKKKTRKEIYAFVRFKADIIHTFLDDNYQNVCILTIDGKALFLSTKKLVDCYTTLCCTEHINCGDGSAQTDHKFEINAEDAFSVPPITLPGALIHHIDRIYAYIAMSSLEILYLEKGNLKVFTSDIMSSNRSLKMNQNSYLKVVNGIDNGEDGTPKLFILSLRQRCQNMAISQALCEQLFDADSIQLGFLLFLNFTGGGIFHLRNSTTEKTSKLFCDLNQPLVYTSCLSITDVQCDTATHAMSEAKHKAETDKLIKSFMKKKKNDCLMFIGKLGKLVILLAQEDSAKSNRISFEYQLPLPIGTCVAKNDLLFVSDFKVINVFKFVIVVKSQQEVEDNNEFVRNIFVPEHKLVYTIPLCDVIKMEFIQFEPLILCCINTKINVIKIELGEISNLIKVIYVPPDLNSLVEKLKLTHLNLNSAKEKSKRLSSVLSQLKAAVSVYHKHKVHEPLLSLEKGKNLQISFMFQHIHHESERKLIVSCVLFNNSMFTLGENWYITIIYYQKYRSVPSCIERECRCKTECFALPLLTPTSCYKFDFLVDASFIRYSEMNIDIYLDYIFHDIFSDDLKNKTKSYGISLYTMSYTVDIIDLCTIVDNTVNNNSFLIPESHFSRILNPNVHFRGNVQDEKEYFCTFLISKTQIKYLREALHQMDLRNYTCDNIAGLVCKFLTKEKKIIISNSMISLVHVSGSKFELKIVPSEDDNPDMFMLKVTSYSYNLLIALHHYIFDMFKAYKHEGGEFKKLYESKLVKLKELKQRCDSIGDNVNEIKDRKISQEELLLNMYGIYGDTRRFVI